MERSNICFKFYGVFFDVVSRACFLFFWVGKLWFRFSVCDTAARRLAL